VASDLVSTSTTRAGVIFIDRINTTTFFRTASRSRHLSLRRAAAAAVWLCCLGSVNLTLSLREAYTEKASFDFAAYGKVCAPRSACSTTCWRDRVAIKRAGRRRHAKAPRGPGLHRAGRRYVMMGMRYDTDERRDGSHMPSRSATMVASRGARKDKGCVSPARPGAYLAAPRSSRLPSRQGEIRKHGLRTVTCVHCAHRTISSLPAKCVERHRAAVLLDVSSKKRMHDNSHKTLTWRTPLASVQAHGRRHGEPAALRAGDGHLGAQSHAHVAAVAPFVDSPSARRERAEDSPYEHFKNLYLDAWHAALKGITTYRQNKGLAACCR